MAELDAALGDWKAPAAWTGRTAPLMAEWNGILDDHQKPTNAEVPTYAQGDRRSPCRGQADRSDHHRGGGLPGELVKGWR